MSDEIKNPNTEDEEYQPDLMTLEDEDGPQGRALSGCGGIHRK